MINLISHLMAQSSSAVARKVGSGGALPTNSTVIVPFQNTDLRRRLGQPPVPSYLRPWPPTRAGKPSDQRRSLGLPPLRRRACRTLSRAALAVELWAHRQRGRKDLAHTLGAPALARRLKGEPIGIDTDGCGSGGAQYLFASWLVRAEHDRFDATGEPELAISASTR